MHKKTLAFAAILGAALGGPALAAPKYKVVEVKNGATISGRVSFSGEVPRLVLTVTKDPKVCHVTGKEGKLSPRLVVGKERGVKNTVVFLTEVRQGKPFPQAKPFLNQKECAFEPHIVLAPLRSKLQLQNGDSVLHNVHGFLDGRTDAFNLAMPQKGKVIEKRLRRPGIISLRCDAGHTWMSGYVFVTRHPYYAVTDEKGQFTIDNIPAGKYTLRVWHERWTSSPKGPSNYKHIQLDIPLSLEDGEKANLRFVLKTDGSLNQEKPTSR